jgi:NTE family protein
MSKRKKIGLALGSGGYRGFAHIGVFKSLKKHKIPIDYISGTSAGALVGAYYALFKNVKEIEQDLIGSERESMKFLLDFNWFGGLIGGHKFVDYLEKRFKKQKFSDVKIPLQIATTDLSKGLPYVFSRGSLARAVRASTSIPLVFKPFLYRGKVLVDGGICNPLPVNLVENMGADIIIGVNLYNKNEFIAKKINMAHVFNRVQQTYLYHLSQGSIKKCDIVIEPDASSFDGDNNFSKYFTKKIAEKLISIGEKATDKAIPRIKAKLKL